MTIPRPAPPRDKPIMREIRNIWLYCGASSGVEPHYAAAAEAFGRALAKAGAR